MSDTWVDRTSIIRLALSQLLKLNKVKLVRDDGDLYWPIVKLMILSENVPLTSTIDLLTADGMQLMLPSRHTDWFVVPIYVYSTGKVTLITSVVCSPLVVATEKYILWLLSRKDCVGCTTTLVTFVMKLGSVLVKPWWVLLSMVAVLSTIYDVNVKLAVVV